MPPGGRAAVNRKRVLDPRLLVAAQLLRLFDRDWREADGLAWQSGPAAAGRPRPRWRSSGSRHGLPVGQQHDRQPAPRHLDGAGTDAVGDDVGAVLVDTVACSIVGPSRRMPCGRPPWRRGSRPREGAAAVRAEMVVLRPPDDADRAAAIVEGVAELVVLAARRLLARERQGRTWAACGPGSRHAGSRIGRQAADEGWQRKAAGDGEVGGARSSTIPTFTTWPRFSRCVRSDFQRLGWRVRCFDQGRRERTDECDPHAVSLDQQVGAHRRRSRCQPCRRDCRTVHWPAAGPRGRWRPRRACRAP